MNYSTIERQRQCSALADLGVPAAAAARLLDAFPDLRGLGASDAAAIAAAAGVRGVPAWATRLAAAFRLVRTADAARDRYRSPVRAPDAAVAYLRGSTNVADAEREHFGIILLDARQRIRGHHVVAIGSLAGVDVHPREVFAEAMRQRAHSVILFHNHPSGDPEASDADIELTRRLCEVGRVCGIPVIDHVIIAGRAAQSLASLGLIA